jgi:hypothetical protein
LIERPVQMSYASTDTPETYQPLPDVVEIERGAAKRSALVRKAAYVAPAGPIDDESVSPPVVSKIPPAGGSAAPASRSNTIEQRPAQNPTRSSVAPAPTPGETVAPGAAASSPPKPPAASRTQDQPASPSPAKKRANELTPGENTKEPALEPAPPLESVPTKRDSLRPRYLAQATRNVLLGRVESDGGEAREGVRVTVSSRTEPGLARGGVSNAFGRFAIRLDDGDWTVRVTMPSGRTYAVRQITVNGGRVIDEEEGRDVPNLVISY